MFWTILLIVFTLILLYVFVLRPVLHKLPALKAFYDDADTFWQKAKALAWNSLTIAWSYVLAAIGLAGQAVDTIGAALGDPQLRDQITQSFADPQIVGRIVLSISIITLLTRLRSIGRT